MDERAPQHTFPSEHVGPDDLRRYSSESDPHVTAAELARIELHESRPGQWTEGYAEPGALCAAVRSIAASCIYNNELVSRLLEGLDVGAAAIAAAGAVRGVYDYDTRSTALPHSTQAAIQIEARHLADVVGACAGDNPALRDAARRLSELASAVADL